MISSQTREPKRPTPQATAPAHAVPRPFTSRVDPGCCREPVGSPASLQPDREVFQLAVDARPAPLAVLDCFAPLPVFFALRLVHQNGTPISPPGGGKIDFEPNGPGHITLEPGETFTLDVDLASLGDLPQPDVYRLSATCHNQDGQPSAQRVLTSNTIDVQVPAEDRP